MTPRDRLKSVDFAVLFLRKVLQVNKIIAENKIIIRPTYPNFKKQVTGNTHIFFCLARVYWCYCSKFYVHKVKLNLFSYHS